MRMSWPRQCMTPLQRFGRRRAPVSGLPAVAVLMTPRTATASPDDVQASTPGPHAARRRRAPPVFQKVAAGRGSHKRPAVVLTDRCTPHGTDSPDDL